MLGRPMLGDGINHVVIDAEDRIWVGWHDQGIYGNEAWRIEGRDGPPSDNGIACFSAGGRVLDVPVMPEGSDGITDCYALTAARSGIWAVPYCYFPIMRFSAGEPARWWRTDLIGPKAIAVDGAHALIAGGYSANARDMVLMALDGPGDGQPARRLATGRLPLRPAPTSEGPDTGAWLPPALLAGRDDTLHMIDDGTWYRWRVADCLAALAS